MGATNSSETCTPAVASAGSRRGFLRGTAGLAAATLVGTTPPAAASDADPRPLRAAVICLGRGLAHVKALLDDPALDAVFIALPNFWHTPAEIIFEGDEGTMAIFRNGSWKIFDAKGVETGGGESSVAANDLAHVANFIAAIRGTAALASPIDEGQKSAMLCHLGNIAYRTGTVVRCDPATGHVLDNPAAELLWSRPAYRVGWGITA